MAVPVAAVYFGIMLYSAVVAYRASQELRKTYQNRGSTYIGLKVSSSIFEAKHEEAKVEPVVFTSDAIVVPNIYPIDATDVRTADGRPVTEKWIRILALSDAATKVLNDLHDMRRKRKCDCVVSHKPELVRRKFMLRAAFFQWCIITVLDWSNFRTGRYKLYVGHTDTEKARGEDPRLPRTVYPKSEGPSFNPLKQPDPNENRHVRISEFKYAGVDFDGFWPSYCTFVEVKHGYGKDTPKTWRAGWHDQLYRQVKAVKLSNRPDCIGNNPLVWVFSNAYAAQEFYALYAKNFDDLAYVPVVSLIIPDADFSLIHKIVG